MVPSHQKHTKFCLLSGFFFFFCTNTSYVDILEFSYSVTVIYIIVCIVLIFIFKKCLFPLLFSPHGIRKSINYQ